MRVLIVDDESLARALLVELLSGEGDVEIVGQAANGFEAVQAVERLRPDLVLLDIRMPKLDGFETLELLGDEAPLAIFVTAHDEHALRAFEVHAVDYVLKPVEPDRLREALGRARERLAARTPGPRPAALAATARPPGRPLERILVREAGKVHVLPVERVDFIEARDDYLSFASAGRRFQKQQTLGELETQLDPQRFVRIHRSYLLNLDRLAGLELYAKDSWVARLVDGTRLPVSRAGHARLRERLG
ncbi:MAG: response regulator [Thermoanaerobaculia bacterium]